MGQSTNAVLAYGYDLGSDEDWKIQEASGEYGELQLDWLTTAGDTEDDEDAGFIAQAKKRLLAQIAGFTETDWQVEGFFTRQDEAEKSLGVEFKSYCSGDYPMYVLAAHAITVHRGDSQLLDLAALAADPAANGWDEKLQAALTALGITPTQQTPGWVLCSYWG
jgi:hypothetical protein